MYIHTNLQVSNQDITPEDGISEGDQFEVILTPRDRNGLSSRLTNLVFSRQNASVNGGTKIDIGIESFQETQPDGVWTYSYSFTVGPRLTQMQFQSFGDFIACDLAYINAHPKTIE